MHPQYPSPDPRAGIIYGRRKLGVAAALLLLCSSSAMCSAADDTAIQELSVFTNTVITSASSLFDKEANFSAINDTAGFVTLSNRIQLWRPGSRQANFSTSFTMDGSSPVALVVLLDRFPTMLSDYGLRGPPSNISPATNDTTNGSNSFAAVEIGTVRSYLPEIPGAGLNVTITPNNSNQGVLAVWIDYYIRFDYLAVSVGAPGRPKLLNDPVARNQNVNLTLRTNQTAFVGFFADKVSTVLGNIRDWNLTVEGLPVPDDGKNKGKPWKVILPSVLGSVGVTAAIGAALAVYFNSKYRRWRKDLEQLAKSMENLPGMPRRIHFAEIKKATNNFHSTMQLGSGAFGAVYRCRLPAAPGAGRQVVEAAIKKFTRSNDDSGRYTDFLEEVSIINRLRHRNIVPLIGWAYHGGVPLLIFELMPNGSLDHHLFRQTTPVLQWEKRYDIIKDIAIGLHYVHHEYEPAVLHRDIKASNVLLDSTFCARLGDFGIACTVPLYRNSVTGFGRTHGYIAPEYACSYKATRETDVYAFGVVVLEVITGKQALYRDGQYSDGILVDRVWQLHWAGKLLDAVDSSLLTAMGFDAGDDAKRLLLLGLACTNPNPSDRPNMAEAVQVITKLAPPPDVPLEKPKFVWPPQGWHPATLGQSSLPSTEMSNFYSSTTSSPTIVNQV